MPSTNPRAIADSTVHAIQPSHFAIIRSQISDTTNHRPSVPIADSCCRLYHTDALRIAESVQFSGGLFASAERCSSIDRSSRLVRLGIGGICLLVHRLACVTLFAVVSFAGLNAHAGSVVVGAVSVSGPSTERSWDNIINQSGMTVPYVSGTTSASTWLASNPQHLGNNTTIGFTNQNPTFNLDFDLGASYSLDRLVFWNYRFNGSAGVKS